MKARTWFPAAFVLASTLSAGVITVGPSGAFTDIQPAIDAAQPGDVLIVEPGSYSPFVLSKALRIYAHPVASIVHHPGVQVVVTGIAAGEEAVIHGFELGTCPDVSCFGTVPGNCYSMKVHNNAGTVLIQKQDSYGILVSNSDLVVVSDSELFGRKPNGCSGHLSGPGVALDATASAVWVVRSTLDGNGSISPGDDEFAGTGIKAHDAAIYVADSTVIGGSGGQIVGSCAGGLTFIGTNGQPGIDASGASLIKVVSGPSNSIVGGNGGATTSFCIGLGAPGIRLAGVSELLLVDSIPVTGGADYLGALHPPVETFDSASAGVTSLIYPLLAGPPELSPGFSTSLLSSGNPGAVTSLYLSLGLGPATLVSGVDGAAVLDVSSLTFIGSATLDPAGFATFPIAVPPIPALIGALGVFQSVEAGGPQIAFSSPLFVAVF